MICTTRRVLCRIFRLRAGETRIGSRQGRKCARVSALNRADDGPLKWPDARLVPNTSTQKAGRSAIQNQQLVQTAVYIWSHRERPFSRCNQCVLSCRKIINCIIIYNTNLINIAGGFLHFFIHDIRRLLRRRPYDTPPSVRQLLPPPILSFDRQS